MRRCAILPTAPQVSKFPFQYTQFFVLATFQTVISTTSNNTQTHRLMTALLTDTTHPHLYATHSQLTTRRSDVPKHLLLGGFDQLTTIVTNNKRKVTGNTVANPLEAWLTFDQLSCNFENIGRVITTYNKQSKQEETQ